jgi:IS605 OrfB family transposase
VNIGGELMQLVRTMKLQLFLNDTERDWLDQTLNSIKEGLNYTSQIAFENDGLSSKAKLQKIVYYDIREQFNLKAQMAVNVCTTVAGVYQSQKSNLKSSKSNKKNIILTKFDNVKVLYSYGRDYSFLKDGKIISINTVEKRIKIPFKVPTYFHKYLNESWKFGAMEICEVDNKYFAHITVNKEIKEQPLELYDNVIGIDLGQNFLATLTDSKGYVKFYKGRYLKDIRAKYKHLRKQLSQKGTHNANTKVNTINQREMRFMTDINHQVSRDIVNYAKQFNSIIVMEDLAGINLSCKVRKKDRYYRVSWAFNQLQEFIEYKALEVGLRVIYIDPAYTSQKCPKCGHTHKLNRDKKNHIFKCRACGYTANDDYVASQNIRDKGIELRHLESIS